MTKNSIFKKILYELSFYKKELIIVMLSIAAVSGAILSLGYTVRLFIDVGIKTGNIASLSQTMGYLVIAVVVLALGSFFRSFYINSISENVISNIRMRTYEALLRRRIRYFDEMKISEINSRFSHDLSLISDIITNLLSFSIRNFFIITGGSVMMFLQDIKLSLIILTAFPVSLLLIRKLGQKVRAMARDLHVKKAALEEVISETLTNIRVVYSFNIQSYRIGKLTSLTEESAHISRKYLRTRAMFFALVIAVITTLMLTVLWIGGLDVIDGTISSGKMVSFMFYALSTAFAMGGIGEVAGELQKSFAGAERIFELQEEEDEEGAQRVIAGNSMKLSNPPKSEKQERISSVSFHVTKFFYPSRPDMQILEDISFEANKGDFIGIAGPSGSGKSTILQIITGLYKADEGGIKINNKPADLALMPDFVKKIAYVPQDPFLFSATIRENITLGRNFGSLDEVMEIAGMREMVASFPKGLDTYVGEKGTQLSGGQKQRISLARSLYGLPDVILLDEATGSLDLESENHVISHVREFMKDKIIISVAHRLSSIKDATKIFLVHNGVLVGSGNHSELLKSSPLYKHMVTFQKV